MSALPGEDGLGSSYANAAVLWQATEGVDDVAAESTGWYGRALAYWRTATADNDGVLGGFASVSPADVAASAQFMHDCAPHLFEETRDKPIVALDCGAGVGRVTVEFLQNHFDHVHLVEPVASLLDQARKALPDEERFKMIYEPLQTFVPPKGTYDAIWIQWCIGHLTDAHFLEFFARCADSLKPNGMLFLKENNASQGRGFVVDNEDSSVTRSDAYLCELFERAGYELVAKRKQKDFPKELYPVRMYALRPPAV